MTADTRTAPASRRLPIGLIEAGRELALVGGLFLLYKLGRQLRAGHEEMARHNAGLVHHLEGVLPLPSESWIQAAMPTWLLHAANIYYVAVHFPLITAFLIWGYVRRPRAEYRWARNLLVALTFLALLIHLGFPLAPPRMFPQWGFVDTMTVIGPSAYHGPTAAVANQYAAMPSLHIGWAVLIAVVLRRTGPRLLAILAWANAAATTAVVIVTANHWWVDGVVVCALLGVLLVLLPGPAPAPRSAGRGPVRLERRRA